MGRDGEDEYSKAVIGLLRVRNAIITIREARRIFGSAANDGHAHAA